MDVNSLITQTLTQVWASYSWIFIFAILLSLLKSRWAKGHIGELLVRLFAHWHLDKQVYRRLHNVTLDTPDGTTQIDHVFLSPFGIFVLETKNMRGWIFGNAEQAQWTQKIYRNTYKFQNPLRQNYKHLKALQATLDIKAEHVHSVVTFVGGTTFKTDMPANVTEGIGCIRYIKSFQTPVFTAAQVDTLTHQLHTKRRAPTLATHREHVDSLKRRSDPKAERKCPKCANALVVRIHKSGSHVGQQFWGCSMFPKCRITQPL